MSPTDGLTPTRPAVWGSPAPIPAAMLNPGLLALLLAGASTGYQREAQEGLPWALSFVVAPMVLHKGTRDALPQRVSSHLPVWIARHPSIRAGFPQRAASLAEPVRKGIRFGVRHGVIEIDGDRITPGHLSTRGADAHLVDLVSKATFIGRWLAKLDQSSTAFAVFGITV